MDARLAFGSIIALCLLGADSSSASSIALTAFEPFGGVPVNNSEEVMRKLAVRLRATGPEIRITECVLPVEYDRAALIAFSCIGTASPDLVLSFGAGGCSLDYETRARNRDDTYAPDNAGVLRSTNSPIIQGGPEYLEFNAPMDQLYSRSPGNTNFPIRSSDDAGAYVCNNVAYWLAHRYARVNSPTRFGFIHVPPTTCGPGRSNPDAIADTLYAAIRAAMPALF